MRALTAFVALVLAGSGASFAQERPCPIGTTGATVVTEGQSSFGPAQPCPLAAGPATSGAPVGPPAIAAVDPPDLTLPTRSLRSASYNPGRPAPANLTDGQRV